VSRLSTVALLFGLSIACSGRERINLDCQWTHDAAFPMDLRETAHQTHLRHDADLMEDLAIRYADEHAGRVARVGWVVVRDECMSKLVAVIGEYHDVSEGQIREWTGRRNLAFDLPVFLSFLVGFSLASRSLMRRLFNGWSFSGVSVFVAGAVTMVVVSAVGGAAGALWAAAWEVIRLGNEHVSHRAARIPWPLYVPGLFAAAFVMCSLVSWREYRAAARRRALDDGSRPTRVLDLGPTPLP
jgi:hypothetical protein